MQNIGNRKRLKLKEFDEVELNDIELVMLSQYVCELLETLDYKLPHDDTKKCDNISWSQKVFEDILRESGVCEEGIKTTVNSIKNEINTIVDLDVTEDCRIRKALCDMIKLDTIEMEKVAILNRILNMANYCCSGGQLERDVHNYMDSCNEILNRVGKRIRITNGLS